MNWWHAAFLGVVEGLTEFLPISSTFHLIMSGKLLGLAQTEFLKVFEVAIQTGGILAVFWLFGPGLLKDKKLIGWLCGSFVVTAIFGLVLHPLIKGVFFESNWLMVSVFIAVGVGFILLERWLKQNRINLPKTLAQLNWNDASLIGLGQAAAVVPGVSRAGAVIVTMLLLRYRRDDAARYSFLIAAPTIMAAGLLDVVKYYSNHVATVSDAQLFVVGLVTAFGSAVVVLKWFIGYVQKHTLEIFGIYRLVAGAGLVAWLLLTGG